MDIKELFRRLSYGELSNMYVGAEGTGSIIESKKQVIIHYTNEALLRLHSRFTLREEEVQVKTQAHITNYHFKKKFALSNEDPNPGDPIYIMDDAHEFQEDLIKILAVYDYELNYYVLNDAADPCSLFTPQPHVLNVPNPIQDNIISVVYQARHPLICYENLDACIDLPVTLEGALTAYIAHMVFSFMNGPENAAKAMEHLNRYEMICRENQVNDLVNSSVTNTKNKFSDRGFV